MQSQSSPGLGHYHDYVSQIALWHRLQVAEGYSRAAEWISQKARNFGLDEVGIERFPTDGKIEYCGNTMPPLWKVKKDELRLTSPFLMKLASYHGVSLSLAAFSASADVGAELVDIGAGTADGEYAAGVKGKVALTTAPPHEVYEVGSPGRVLPASSRPGRRLILTNSTDGRAIFRTNWDGNTSPEDRPLVPVISASPFPPAGLRNSVP